MLNQFIKFIRKTAGNKIIQHLLFWGFSFLILANILKVSADISKIDLIYTAIFHLPILLVVYMNLNLLFPFFLEKTRYFLYLVAIISLLSMGAGFYLVLFNYWIDLIFTGYYFIAYYGFWDISLYLLIYVSLSGLLHLARGWFRLQKMEKEKTINELKALKSQINPHFLFNSLNSIYSLARKNSGKVPEKIVQLSDLLRHVIYESEADFILLEKELDMVKNYIELQNLRAPENDKIKLTIKGNIRDKEIAPLLFIPFVENSFKHGLKSGAHDAFVKIKIEVNNKMLDFEIINNKGKFIEKKDGKYKGTGIENVRKRLELIYPSRHSLKIIDNDAIFKVHLQVQLQ